MEIEIKKTLLINEIKGIISFLKLWSYRNKSFKQIANKIINDMEIIKCNLKKELIINIKHIEPFLYLVSCEETDGRTTLMVLKSIYTIIIHEIIDNNIDPSIVCMIIDTINDTKFTIKNISNDEIVLFEILEIFKILISKNMCNNLNDHQICSCLHTCFRIYFETKFSELLSCSAENVIINFILFILKNDHIWNNNIQSNNHISSLSSSNISRTVHKKNVYSLSSYVSGDNTNIKSVNTIGINKCGVNDTNKDCVINTNQSNVSDTSKDDVIDINKGNVSDAYNVNAIDINKGGVSDTNKSNVSNTNKSNVSDTNKSSVSETIKSNVSDLNKTNVNETNKSNLSDVKSSSDMGEKKDNESDKIKKFGISSIYEIMKFIISLCDQNYKNNKKEYMEFSLLLLRIIIEIGGKKIMTCNCMINLIREKMCKNLNDLIFYHDSLVIFNKSISLLKILIRYRNLLKNEIEIIMINILDTYYKNIDKNTISEKRDIIKEFLIELSQDYNLMMELYINYDIQINYYNLFEYYIIVICHIIIMNEYNDDVLLIMNNIINLLNYIDKSSSSLNDKNLENIFMNDLINKKNYISCINLLNININKGINKLIETHIIPENNYEQDLANILKYDINIDRKVVGECIGNRNYTNLLKCYIECFDVKNDRIDIALRNFLESFRIPGESPVISIILEEFCQHYHTNNPNIFSDPDSVFTLCYAIIMLNVDQHNTNVKQQKSMVLDDFINNMRGVNGGNDFDISLLTTIYENIRNNEIIVPIERNGIIKNNYIWKLTNERSRKIIYKFNEINNKIIMNKLFFNSIITHFITCSFIIMERNIDMTLYDKTLCGIVLISSMCVKYQMNNIIDKNIIQLLKLSKILKLSNESSSANISLQVDYIIFDLVCNIPSQKCLIEAFKLINLHFNQITFAWKYVLCCVSTLCACELLPIKMYKFEDYVKTSSIYYLVVGKRLNKKTVVESLGSSFIDSFVQMISSSSTSLTDMNENIISDEVFKSAQNLVKECKIDELFNNFENLSYESYKELGECLIKFSNIIPYKITYDIDNEIEGSSSHIIYISSLYTSIFFIENLLIFSLTNKTRIDILLPNILQLLLDLTSKSSQYTPITERAIQGLLRFIIRLIDLNQNISNQLMLSLRSLLINPLFLIKSSLYVVYGLYEFIRSRFNFIQSFWDWICILEILEISGCGKNTLLTSVSICSEMLHNHTSTHIDSTINIHDMPMSEIYQQKALYDAIDDANKDELFKSSSIIEFDIHAFIKTIQCIAFLILTQPTKLTHINILPILHCLTSCAERMFYLSKMYINPQYSKYFAAVSDKQMEINTTCILDMMFNMFHLSSDILLTYIQKLDISCQSLSPEDSINFLWHSCWSNLLKRMAYFIIDSRRNIRLTSMYHIERALRNPEWYLCFQRILFPMLDLLIQQSPLSSSTSTINDSTELDETRSRALGLVMRIFLQNLSHLYQYEQFYKLWQTMLELFVKFYHLKSTDILQEAIPEYLKNILSVMITSNLIPYSNTINSIYNITYIFLTTYFTDLLSLLPPPNNTIIQNHNNISSNTNTQSFNTNNDHNINQQYDQNIDQRISLPINLPNFKIVTSYVTNDIIEDNKTILD